MKKILYLHAGAELYGADIVLMELLKNLDKNRFKPYVVLPCDGPLVQKLKENNIEVEVINYPILRRKYFNPLGIIKYIKDYIIYSNKLIKIAKDKKIDIVHTNTAAVLEGMFVKRRLKLKQIWHIHEIIVKPKFMNKLLSYFISKNSDEVITVSNAVKKHLLETGFFKENSIKVIYNGVDNKIFNSENNTKYLREEFNIPQDALVVGMIGRVNAWKGQQDFLEAMDIVLENKENVYAMLVGGVFEGEEWRINQLNIKINSMKNKDKVIFSEYRNDTKNIHALYDIFVLPSTNPDPLPTVVLEAMASRTTIVGYKHGGICEMVEDGVNGSLAEVKNINALAEQILKFINDDVEREKSANESQKRQKFMFSLESYIENFESIYSEV
ncbi:glycosyltransferase family 4 protein [uncultured Clostridium sp.]|uniref:glycosyltransferase family 4 protein n=1 Tax=uncultured Clostridium sp. TaxID=59620 RepID=UPI0026727848|nr:glycosyltransferase family 4 protein [uncultured Clostridium sp.]